MRPPTTKDRTILMTRTITIDIDTHHITEAWNHNLHHLESNQ